MLLARKHYGSRRLIRIIDIILEEEYETTWTRLGNRAVRGRVGGFVHSVHRILHMLSDAAGMIRHNLRIYGSRAGGCQFQSTIVPITCPLFLSGFRFRKKLFQCIQAVLGSVASQYRTEGRNGLAVLNALPFRSAPAR